MADNVAMLDKLDMAFKGVTVSTLNQSVLQPQYFNQFVQEAIRATTILDDARLIEMDSQRVNIDRTGFVGRILQAATEAVPADPNKESVPEFKQNQLVAGELLAETGITDQSLRRNIEKGDFQNTLVSMFSTNVGCDLEAFAVFSNPTSTIYTTGSVMLQGTGGWLKKAVDAGQVFYGTGSGKDFDGTNIEGTLQYLLTQYPKAYMKNKADLVFYVPWNLYDAYINAIIARVGNMADTALTGDFTPAYKGIPVKYASVLDDTEGNNAFGQVIILVNPDNLVYGIFEKVTIEPYRLPRERKTSFILTIETDQHYENEKVVIIGLTNKVKGSAF